MLLLVAVCAPPSIGGSLPASCLRPDGRASRSQPVRDARQRDPRDPVFALADHPHLTTHYGRAYTLLSALAAAIAPSTVLGVALAWKVMSAGAALGCAFLAARVLRGLGGTQQEAEEAQLWLAWNPLLILESADSGHIEPIMMVAALAGILLWQRGRQARGVIVLVVSTLTKWFSGLVLVFAIVREAHHATPGRKLPTILRLTAIAGLATALLYLPFASGLTKRAASATSPFAARPPSARGRRPVCRSGRWSPASRFWSWGR